MGYQEFTIEGRNAVIEAYRAGKPIDKLFILDGCQDGPMMTIKREAKKHDTLVKYVTKERLDQLSETGKHQGVIAYAAAYEYAEVDDILEGARKKGEPPFIFLLDNIEDPHNLGAIIRTANLAGAHGVIIPKNRAAGLTATVARTSAGALNYTPVARVTNIGATIEELKKEGIWFVCADMDGEEMYSLNLKGPIGLVIGTIHEDIKELLEIPDEYQAISIVSSRTGTVAQAITIDDAVKAVNAKLLRFEMAIDAGKQCGQGCLFVLGAENISDARRLVEIALEQIDSVSYTHLRAHET